MLIALLLGSPSFSAPSPRSYVIGIDLHDTFLEKTHLRFFAKIGSLFYQCNNKKAILGLVFKAHHIVMQVRDLRGNLTIPGQFIIEHVCSTYVPLNGCQDQLTQALSVDLYQPNPAMIKLVQELKNKGYNIYLVSNIGPKAYAFTLERYPQALALFDDYFIPDKVPNKRGKPACSFYYALRAWLDQKGHKDQIMLFFDDLQSFVDGANNTDAHIKGIHFVSTAPMRNELEARGILEKEPSYFQRMRAFNFYPILNFISICFFKTKKVLNF